MKQYEKIGINVLEMESDSLLDAKERIKYFINEAVETIFETKGKLIITGVGKSGLVGAKMAATFASTGTPSFFLHPTEAMHGDLGMISSGDTVIAISNSGESEELVQILPHLKRLQVPVIGMSANRNSSLGSFSDVFIDISVKEEACPLNSAPTTSTTLTMAMGDVLAVCMMERRDFKQEDFASFHPGGSLGKRLFVKALDLARTENLPVISSKASLKEAIDVMTSGKLGSVLIMDSDILYGVLSDGDLRRALMDEKFSLDNCALEYATKDPKKVNSNNLLASDALKIIEDGKIQLLILINDEEKLEGILHIHDLVEAGIET